METNRERGPANAGGSAIRLKYSRQFQQGGHTHTIDAETVLAVGAGQERREQALRELEGNVEQLVRQIVRRGGASGNEQAGSPRQASPASQVSTSRPVSESMPTTPVPSSKQTVTLADFVKVIRDRWNMSAKEAMDLLNVNELSSLNLREAFFRLRTIKEPQSVTGAGSTRDQSATAGSDASRESVPVRMQPLELPRQASRPFQSTSASRPPVSGPLPEPVNGSVEPIAQEYRRPTLEQLRESFASSSGGPLPIHLGMSQDQPARPRSFDEEETEEEYELHTEEEEDSHRQAALKKLEDLKGLRTGAAASAERLAVLNTVLGEQLSGEQLLQLIKLIWGVTSKKRLKIQQVEELISWVKSDYFVEEAQSLLAMIDEEDEEEE